MTQVTIAPVGMAGAHDDAMTSPRGTVKTGGKVGVTDADTAGVAENVAAGVWLGGGTRTVLDGVTVGLEAGEAVAVGLVVAAGGCVEVALGSAVAVTPGVSPGAVVAVSVGVGLTVGADTTTSIAPVTLLKPSRLYCALCSKG